MNNNTVENCNSEHSVFKLSYGDLQFDKQRLKKLLLEEQNGLCAYCQRRIEKLEDSHIEHFVRQSEAPGLSLNYYNLFVSCNGEYDAGKDASDKSATCGKYKDDKKHSPAMLIYAEKLTNCFRYYEDGSIAVNESFSEETKIEAMSLINSFKLNFSKLQQARAVYRSEVLDFIMNNVSPETQLHDIKAKALNVLQNNAGLQMFPGILLTLEARK